MKEYNFNAKENINRIINSLREWEKTNANGCNFCLGLSGGKDSTIVAALLCKAFGKDRVIGIAMPDENQGLNDADKIAEYLGIKFEVKPIGDACKAIMNSINEELCLQSLQNIAPRIRMVTLYCYSQNHNGRVVGTENTSECYLGYFTKAGDEVSDIEPIKSLTVTELLSIGDELGLPKEWVHKIPSDNLKGSTSDEAKFGFTYEVLDKYIRGIEEPSSEIKEKIDNWHNKNLFKLLPKVEF